MIGRDYPPKFSGIATHTSELAKSLRNLGVDVDVFAGYSDIKTLFVPLSNDLQNYDIVHVQSTPYGAFVNHPNVVMTVHAPVLVERQYYPFFTKLKCLGAVPCEKRALRKVKQIIAVSKKTKNDMIGLYGVPEEKIIVIYNGVDCEKFKLASKSHSGVPQILMCSRLDKRKNIPDALKTLAKLRDLPYRCDIVGDGPERVSLERMAMQLDVNVWFKGIVSDEELVKYYADADIFLSTSISEGFNLTILESMASGCAVLASDIPSHREFVRYEKSDSINGMIYKGPDDLIACLMVLINNPNLRNEMKCEGRKTALQLSWNNVAQKTIQIYEKVLEG